MDKQLLLIRGGIMRKLFEALLLSLAVSCTQPGAVNAYDVEKQLASFNASRSSRSFVFINTDITTFESSCDIETDECESIEGEVMSATGSGMTIKIGRKKYVLTAAHVCSPAKFNPSLAIMDVLELISVKLTGTGFYGNKSDFEIVAIDVENDICILKPSSWWISPHVPMARNIPDQGSKLFVTAAPLGIFEPGMVLTFEGYFGGIDSDGDMIMSIPTRPGSSGSAILNEQGKIVGVIHSAISQFESVGIGTPIEKVHDLIEAMH
jgi:S1-C subfamily serine protease